MINPYIGEVSCFGFAFAPAGWISCDGSLLPVDEFKGLFNVIGNAFGGDGVSTFGVPNFSSMTEDGGQFCISLFGATPTGGRKGLPGETTIFPYSQPPGWIQAHGRLLLIAQYAALYKILGNTFGGDGVTTFGVPDMSKESPFNVPGDYGPSSYCIADVPSGSTDQGFTGEIKIFPATAPPQGWLPCDGRLLPISGNTAMFSLLMTTYGGDGKTTFGLPNITVCAGLTCFICQLGVYPSRPEA